MAVLTKEERISDALAFAQALPTYCSSMTFMLGGKIYTCTEGVAMATSVASAGQASIQAKAAYHKACVAEQETLKTQGVILEQLRENLALAFSNEPETLAALKIAVRKPPTRLSTQALAAKEAKAKATRAARGTTSKKQKATVKGAVTGVEITPTTATGAGVPLPTTTAATPVTVTPVATGSAAAAPVPGTSATTHP
jgi:hypothetical protein